MKIVDKLKAHMILKATSNVIEIKPDKQYMLIFKSNYIKQDTLEVLAKGLKAVGIKGFSCVLQHDDELQIVEMDKEDTNE